MLLLPQLVGHREPRGHRELPIRPDYVGKNLPTHVDDDVRATQDGVVITNRVSS